MSSIEALLHFGFEAVETLDPAAAVGADQPQIRHRNFVNFLRLGGASLPPVTSLVMSRVILTSGQATISLQSAPATGSPGTQQNLTGKRLVYSYYGNARTNGPVTVRGQAINGYWPFGGAIQMVLQPGWKMGTFHDDELPVVGATNNVILFVGTADEVLDVALLFG